MTLKQHAIGPKGKEFAYVWSEPGKPMSKAVITAHGDSTQSHVDVPDSSISLVYYGPHGHIVKDIGLVEIMSHEKVPVETLAAHQSPDYSLSKYTNANGANKLHQHNSQGETYATVGGMDGLLAGRHAHHQQSIANKTKALSRIDATKNPSFHASTASQLNVATQLAKNTVRDMDVITIRNRGFRGWALGAYGSADVMLSDLIKALDADGRFHFTELHCYFCRGGGAAYTPDQNAELFA